MAGITLKRRNRPGFSLFGLLLVGIGLVLLLNTTGVLPFGIWFELARYWPVLLILIGVKLILARRAPLIGLGVASIALVATVVAASVSLNVGQSDEPIHATYVTPLENTEILHLGMGFFSGHVAIRSDPSAERLFAADFSGRPAEVIHDHSGRFSKIYLSTRGLSVEYSDGADSHTLSGLVDWDLMVSPDVALDLEIRAGAADLDLDLTELNVRRLTVGAGASDIRIRLPRMADETRVEVAVGAADIEIEVPHGVAAQVSSDVFLSSMRIDLQRFPEADGVYRSRDYATAANRVDIDIDGAAVEVSVN